MAEAKSKEAPQVVKETPQAPIRIGLDEFCSRLSETVRSPESIAAFHQVERSASRGADTEAAYRARFDKFMSTPL